MNGLDLLIPQNQDNRIFGVMIGLVTNNQDPDKMGRVKVEFPTLSQQNESNWARIASPMAGKERGLYFLPEVGDEVLVVFEHGDINFPYILGALWNGKDKPPSDNSDGKNDQRIIQSRSGHKIILDDKEGEEKIIIQDKTGKNKVMIDSKSNTMSVTVEKDLAIETKGKITIKSNEDDITIDCKNLSIKTQEKCQIDVGSDCSIEAKNKYELKANAGLGIKCFAGVKINDGALEVI